MPPALHSVVKHYRVNRSDLAFLKYVIESYEGLAMVTTLGGSRGRVVLRIAPGCEETVAALMADLGGAIRIEAQAPPSEDESG